MTSIETTLEERGNRYGVFAEHARITQNMKRAMIDSPNWQRLQDDQRECLEMLALKIGRVLNGDPDYHDSWHDIIGYTKLVADRLALAAETFGPLQDVFTLDEINQMIDELNAVDAGPMTEEEETEYKPELTYGDHAKALEKRGVSRIDLQAINHAHIEPRDRSDVAGNEVQPIGIKLRESAAHDWMYNDDAEVVPPKQNDGWIEWHGGECPVDKNATVLVKFEETGIDDEPLCLSDKAGHFYWHWRHEGCGSDIVAYKITAPAVARE